MINKNSALRFTIKLLKVLAVLLVGIVILVVIAINWDFVAMGKVVRGKHWVGLLVKDDGKPPEGWTPTKELVLNLEDDLKQYVIKNLEKDTWIVQHLPEYKIQYSGYVHDGKKILQIRFDHNSTVRYGLWKIPFGVLGGGCNHFRVIYDAGQKKFTEISINCDA